MKKIVVMTVLLLFIGNYLFGVENETSSINEIFKLANEKYKKGKYEEAIELYKNIIKKGIKNGYVYYNLGNAYLKNKELGKAILNYEKAKLYIPSDKDLNYNLKYANMMKIDKFKVEESNPFLIILKFIYNLFNVNTLFIISYILFLLLIIYFIIKWLVKDFRIKNINDKLFPYLLSLFIFFALLLSVKIYVIESSNYGIIISKEVDVKSGPGDEYTVMFNLHEGTKVEEKKYSDEWVLIATPNGFSGWIKKNEIESIE